MAEETGSALAGVPRSKAAPFTGVEEPGETDSVPVAAANGGGAGMAVMTAAAAGLGWFNIAVRTASEIPCCRKYMI